MIEKDACIYVVATPIGNLSDMSARARMVLAEVDLVLAEDTRVARKLLNSFDLDRKTILSFHDHVEKKRTPEIIERILREGLRVAIVSDAGTPCIADPGYALVAAAHAAGIKVSPVPGPSALLALASSSGLPTDRLMFVGFLPEKERARLDEVRSWLNLSATIVFFESLRRASKSFKAIAEVFPNARVAVGREMTKLYEEIHLFTIGQAIEWIETLPVQKGELAVAVHLAEDVMAAQEAMVEDLRTQIQNYARKAFASGQSLKDILKHWSKAGMPRSELYQLLLEIKSESD